jgi:REP element-mobilizing transposase RayT
LDIKKRKRQRLFGYDYKKPGGYYITISIDSSQIKLGKIHNQRMKLNKLGSIVDKCWKDLPNHYVNIKLDEYVIMPDHFHAIIHIIGPITLRNGLKPFRTHGLSEIVRAFKTFSSREINDQLTERNFKWHKSFNDRIIRKFNNEIENFRFFIRNNPKNYLKEKH